MILLLSKNSKKFDYSNNYQMKSKHREILGLKFKPNFIQIRTMLGFHRLSQGATQFFIKSKSVFSGTPYKMFEKKGFLPHQSHTIKSEYATKIPSQPFKVGAMTATPTASAKTKEFIDQSISASGVKHDIVYTEGATQNTVILNGVQTGAAYVKVTNNKTGKVTIERTGVIDNAGYADGSSSKLQRMTIHSEVEVSKSDLNIIENPLKTAHVQQPHITAALEAHKSKASDISVETKAKIAAEKLKTKI